jgi:hypothetical protein
MPQPEGLTRSKLLDCDLPTDWELQRQLLGFAPRRRDAIGPTSALHVSAGLGL